jgi:xeroderma pigmentosum group C-complementing protein
MERCPSSQAACKSHPLFVLEKNLGKFQTLRPRTPVVGMISGLPVFLRTCVRELQTARQWKLKGRKVRWPHAPPSRRQWRSEMGLLRSTT